MDNKINIKYISPDPNQPRKFFDAEKLGKLKKSIEKYGIINPLVVEKINDKEYLLVDGERRFKAAALAGLKEVPVNVIPPQAEIDRLVRQFHIQEQQEGWNQIEKASVLSKMAEDLKMPVSKACEMLGIAPRTGGTYVAFSKLADKDLFQRSEINIKMANSIISLRDMAKRMVHDEFGEKFIKSDEKTFERAMIDRIVEGELKTAGDFAKVRDSFNTNPKFIKKFMETDIGINKMFKESKAESTHHLRNASQNSQWCANHLNRYMESPEIKPTQKEIYSFRFLKKTLDSFISKIE